jgi:hypothetical protein
MHGDARQCKGYASNVSGGGGSNCNMAGHFCVCAHRMTGVVDKAEGGKERVSQAVLGLRRRATQGAEAVGRCQWFALSEGDLTWLDQLGVAIARLPLTGLPSREYSRPPGMQPAAARAIKSLHHETRGSSRHLLESPFIWPSAVQLRPRELVVSARVANTRNLDLPALPASAHLPTPHCLPLPSSPSSLLTRPAHCGASMPAVCSRRPGVSTAPPEI